MHDTASCLALALATLLASAQDVAREASVGGDTSPKGTRAAAPIPKEQHMRNTGGMGPRGPGSGAGLCVFTSIEVCARWQNVAALDGWQKYMMSREGGGYPQKVDLMLQAFCRSKGVPVPKYLQSEGGDMALLELAMRTGRPAGVTYGYSPTGRYGGRYIPHMVTLSHGAGDEWAIIDNNFPHTWEWMSRAEFQRAFNGKPGEKGWCVILLDPPAPPPPDGGDSPPPPPIP